MFTTFEKGKAVLFNKHIERTTFAAQGGGKDVLSAEEKTDDQ